MRVAGMMLTVMAVRGARCIRIAQDDRESAVLWREHEACRNERPQAEHRQYEQRAEAAYATTLSSVRSLTHRAKNSAPALRRLQVVLPCTDSQSFSPASQAGRCLLARCGVVSAHRRLLCSAR